MNELYFLGKTFLTSSVTIFLELKMNASIQRGFYSFLRTKVEVDST